MMALNIIDKEPRDLSVSNAASSEEDSFKKILAVGLAGAGKSFQIPHLPGKKFVYVFDPNAVSSYSKAGDVDYKTFYPQATELDATIKGFNKGARDDKLPAASKREPTVYMDWVNDLNDRVEAGFFEAYDWFCVDSLTLLVKATMDRQLYINNRYGSIEDIADYRVVGSKLAEIFRSVVSLPINIYCTAHYTTFQNDKSKVISTEVYLPGQAKVQLPILMTDIWLFKAGSEGKNKKFVVQTVPQRNGLQTIRTSRNDLEMEEDITVTNADASGIARIL